MLGHIGARRSEAVYSKQIQGAIAYRRDTDVSGMEEGRYPRDGDDFIVLINQRRTGSREGKLPEARQEYAELQYMVSGREYMGFYPDRGDNEVLKDCLEEKNTLYYEENPDSGEMVLPLIPGFYRIFFPEGVHRPFCQVGGPESIEKIAVKMRVSAPQGKSGFMTTGLVVIKHRLFSFDRFGSRLQQLQMVVKLRIC